MSDFSKYTVLPISRSQCENLVINVHYAHRWPSISYAYGLYKLDKLVGIVTYGTPPSATLRSGVAGHCNSSKVIELNRLCLLDNLKNEASFLVSKSLRLLPKGLIVVSFADTSQGHIGPPDVTYMNS